MQQHAGAVVLESQGMVQSYHRNQSTEDHVSGTQIVEVALSMWLRVNPDLS